MLVMREEAGACRANDSRIEAGKQARSYLADASGSTADMARARLASSRTYVYRACSARVQARYDSQSRKSGVKYVRTSVQPARNRKRSIGGQSAPTARFIR